MLRTDPEYRELLKTIYDMLTSRGIKATTMDSVAAAKGISKRTLYEIFGSKDEMLCEVFEYMGEIIRDRNRKAFEESDNVIEALVKVFDMHCDMMQSLSPEFFRDMDLHYRNVRSDYQKFDTDHEKTLLRILHTGVDQGLIRNDVNLMMALRLAKVQIESLKRMEDIFPEDITLPQALNYISYGFLRSIATDKGIGVLEKTDTSYNKKFININNNN